MTWKHENWAFPTPQNAVGVDMDKWASPIGKSITFGYFVFHTPHTHTQKKRMKNQSFSFLALALQDSEMFAPPITQLDSSLPNLPLHSPAMTRFPGLHFLRSSKKTHSAPLSRLGSSQHCAWLQFETQLSQLARLLVQEAVTDMFCWDKILVFCRNQTSFHSFVFHSNLQQSWNIKSNHILMEMIPSTVGTQDFRLIWNEQKLTNLDINEIHGWIEPFTKRNCRISVADGNLQFGKLLNLRMAAWRKLKEPAKHVQCPPTVWKYHLAKLPINQEFVPFEAACMELVPLKHPWKICKFNILGMSFHDFSHTRTWFTWCAVEVRVFFGKVRLETKQSVECDWLRCD